MVKKDLSKVQGFNCRKAWIFKRQAKMALLHLRHNFHIVWNEGQTGASEDLV